MAAQPAASLRKHRQGFLAMGCGTLPNPSQGTLLFQHHQQPAAALPVAQPGSHRDGALALPPYCLPAQLLDCASLELPIGKKENGFPYLSQGWAKHLKSLMSAKCFNFL